MGHEVLNEGIGIYGGILWEGGESEIVTMQGNFQLHG